MRLEPGRRGGHGSAGKGNRLIMTDRLNLTLRWRQVLEAQLAKEIQEAWENLEFWESQREVTGIAGFSIAACQKIARVRLDDLEQASRSLDGDDRF